MPIRFPLTIEHKKPRRSRVWLTNLAGLLIVVLTVALYWCVFAAVTE